MKASVSDENREFEIILSDREIEKLKTKILSGKIRMRQENPREEHLNNIKLKLGKLEDGTFIEMKSYPKEEEFMKRDYKFLISQDAYESLVSRGATGERIYHNVKVKIMSEDWINPISRYERYKC